MKQHSSISKEKLISLEEGLAPEAGIFTRVRTAASNNPCKQIAQCVKIILYLLFVGLAGYAMWQTFSINSMEFKVINRIRESQGLFSQRSTFDKRNDAAGQFHHSKGESISSSMTKNLEALDLDSKTSFTDENDDEPLNATDVYRADDVSSVTTEFYEIYETDNEGVVNATASTDEIISTTTTTTTTTTDKSPIEDVDSNSSIGASDEMKLKRDQEEILDVLLSLIIRNARSSHIIDSYYYDNGFNDYAISETLHAQNSNDVEEENSQGTQETQETQGFVLFVNGDDYQEGNSENSDYQTETVTESPAEDYYAEFSRPYYGPHPWRIYEDFNI